MDLATRRFEPEGLPGAEVARVLLISERDRWAGQIAADLAGEGFRVLRDRDGGSAFDDARIGVVDAAVVDLRLRTGSGLAVCGAIRSRSIVPILAMGDLDEERAVLAAYTAGADQYAPIETSSRLVLARLRALLRRVPPVPRPDEGPLLAVDVGLDRSTSTAVVGGAVVKLSPRELEVLQVLLARPGRVVPRRELAGAWAERGDDRRLDFVIRRLRQKLEAVDGRRRITAVRGVGFRFDAPRSSSELSSTS